jgi:hypothetical protein
MDTFNLGYRDNCKAKFSDGTRLPLTFNLGYRDNCKAKFSDGTNYSKYRKVGHLWQGRFKSKPIVKGQYLINCAEYIEANPVRAEMVTDIAAYPWSSYNERCLSSSKDILDEMLIKDTDIKEGDTFNLGYRDNCKAKFSDGTN